MGLRYPQKCRVLGKELQYMGNTIFIKDRRVCIKPLRSRKEAIKKLHHLLQPRVVEVLQEW